MMRFRTMEELIRYYENNREGLLPYQSQGLDLPTTRRAGIPEHGNNGEPCVECNCKADETRAQELETGGVGII